MKIMLDTNVIMDVLQKREPFFQASYDVLRLSAIDEVDSVVSASALTDIFYLLRRELKSAEAAKTRLSELLMLVSIADVQAVDIHAALDSGMADFEDAVVHAVALRHKADYIITRNEKDFTGAQIKVISPADFINTAVYTLKPPSEES